MRTLALLSAALVTACSHGGPPRPDQRDKVANASSRALADDVPETRDPPQSFAIPIAFAGNLTAGAEPSPEHPAGTVYFDGIVPGLAGVALAEWDLASGKAVRRTVLPLDRKDQGVLASGGGALHVVHRGLDNRTYYLRLSPELKVLSRTLVYELEGWDATAVASDGKVTVVVGPYWSPDGVAGSCFANTYDERGKQLGHRSLDEDGASQLFASMAHDAVVLDGKVYILVHRGSEDPDDRLHVIEYSSDLTPITSSVVPQPPQGAPSVIQDLALRLRERRLVVEVPPARYELSPDLTDIKEAGSIARAPHEAGDASCGDDVYIGPVRAAVCTATSAGHSFITWDR